MHRAQAANHEVTLQPGRLVTGEDLLRAPHANHSETDSHHLRNDKTTDMQTTSFYQAAKEIQIEDYPDESTFVYKSQRKNIQLVKPSNRDAFRQVSTLSARVDVPDLDPLHVVHRLTRRTGSARRSTAPQTRSARRSTSLPSSPCATTPWS